MSQKLRPDAETMSLWSLDLLQVLLLLLLLHRMQQGPEAHKSHINIVDEAIAITPEQQSNQLFKERKN